MKKIKTLFLLLLAFAGTNTRAFAQNAPEFTVAFLANDNIADINIDQEKYVAYIQAVMEIMKREFAIIPSTQKVVLMHTTHKTGKPTLALHAKPALAGSKEEALLREIGALPFENTRVLDFPVMINVNVKNESFATDFSEIILPAQKTKNEYEKASLKKKYELNKSWAVNEVLPVLGTYEATVDEQFAGVKNFGKLVLITDFSGQVNLASVTARNSDYWRAGMEMNVGNQLIPVTSIFTLIAQGDFDYAGKLLKMVNMFSDPKTTADGYLAELAWRLEQFDSEVRTQLQQGIAEHDKGNYSEAIGIYNNVLASYPNSAWALYELYFSQNALDVKNKKVEAGDRSNWDKAKVAIYRCDPLYHLDVRASNAREGYLLYRRQEMSSLFKKKEEKLNDVQRYADIAMDLGVYDFAAQLFWYSFMYGKDNTVALYKYLYCIEKQGVTNLKSNFKGDFDAEFKKIEEAKAKEMTESIFYKAFKEK